MGFDLSKHAKTLKVSRNSEELVKFRKFFKVHCTQKNNLRDKNVLVQEMSRVGHVSGLDLSQVLEIAIL